MEYQAPLPFSPRLKGPPPFRPSASQQDAQQQLARHAERFARAPSGLTTILLIGAQGAGKTRVVDEFDPVSSDETCDALDVHGLDPLALFGLINSSTAERRVLVIEARVPPVRWYPRETDIPPDLQSRLSAVPIIELDRPSAMDLQSVLAADLRLHGQRLSDSDLDYVVDRLPRDLGAPRQFCRSLDLVDQRLVRRDQLQWALEKVHVAPLKPF
ncbi:MAG: hypothetical protein AAFX52_11450 [Pseudomonadota bacterium]